jgi:hypothetical protein
VVDHPVLVLMRNDIDRVRSEFPTLDADVIERIYQQLVMVLLRTPTEDEFRARVTELTARMDGPTLRGFFGLPPRPDIGARGRRRVAPPDSGDGARAIKRSGRPGWTAQLFWDRYREAVERTSPPYTQRAVAQHFQALHGDRGVDPEYLRKLLRRYGPPPETG